MNRTASMVQHEAHGLEAAWRVIQRDLREAGSRRDRARKGHTRFRDRARFGGDVGALRHWEARVDELMAMLRAIDNVRKAALAEMNEERSRR